MSHAVSTASPALHRPKTTALKRVRSPNRLAAMVATIVANLLGDRTLFSAVVFGLCNAGEAVLTAWLIERYFGSGFALDRLRQVLGFLAAAVVRAAVSGI